MRVPIREITLYNTVSLHSCIGKVMMMIERKCLVNLYEVTIVMRHNFVQDNFPSPKSLLSITKRNNLSENIPVCLQEPASQSLELTLL